MGLFGYLSRTVKSYPEITPLLTVVSFAGAFGVYSVYHFLSDNTIVATDHRTHNWEKQEVRSGKTADAVHDMIVAEAKSA
eukprot:m.134268 g.134268  ORF g.134268 m.134268 type:complete len:80 (-) comp9541_c0_seq1:408-647(-)